MTFNKNILLFAFVKNPATCFAGTEKHEKCRIARSSLVDFFVGKYMTIRGRALIFHKTSLGV